jgi:hypothetical protein
MLVYGDLARRVSTAAVIESIASTLRRVSALPPGIERHAALVSAFIGLGELAQGIADSEFDARGVDARSPAQDGAMAALMRVADAVRRSWDSELVDSAELPPSLLDALSNADLPEGISVKRPEGYAFYALYPESYLQAASALGDGRLVRVIGIRSIGTGLAALVASVVGAAQPVTVRPTGDPFRREIRVADELAAELLSDAEADFAIVDEGPGLSGSSFGAVADWLEARRIAADRIHFFPSHANDLGPMASARHRDRWQKAPRHVVEFDDLVLHAAGRMHRLDGWAADLIGEPDAPLDDISGGGWRSRRYASEAEWPPCHVQQERRKFLASARGATWLLKFAGLGREGAQKLVMARSLHDAGFSPEPVGYRHGFLVERWITDARPLTEGDRAALIERLGAYIGFRARAFPADTEPGASFGELFEMARHNAAKGLDDEAPRAIEPWRGRLGSLEGHVRRVRTDNRLHAWEWLRMPDGRLIKADAVDHHAAHDLIGCQDAAWDIAGARVEFDLSDEELAELCRVFETVAQTPVNRDLLAFYKVCYAAFQLGHWSLAAESLVGFPGEAFRTRAAADRYRGELRQILQRL